MIKKIMLFCIFCSTFCSMPLGYAQIMLDDGLGQIIQINTRLHSFLGKPSWTLILRDVETGDVFPYIYDIERGLNSWVALSYSRNYLITVSRMQFSTYDARCNSFKKYQINNFCNLESNGRIIRGKSMNVLITGDLSPNTDTFSCLVTSYQNSQFAIAVP